MRTTDYVELDAKKGGDVQKPEKEPSWLRSHWCIFCYIILAIVGVGFPLYMYLLAPCNPNIVTAKQPVDLIFMLDGSGSIEAQYWIQELNSTTKWIDVFKKEIAELQVSIITFSDFAELNFELSDDIDSAIDTVNSLADDQPMSMTNYIDAFDMLVDQLEVNGNPEAFRLGVMISDGMPYIGSRNVIAYVEKTIAQAQAVREQNVTLTGVIVDNVEDGDALFECSSCDDYTYNRFGNQECPFFFEANHWDEFSANVKNIAHDVVAEVGTYEKKTCDAAWSFIFLLLALPLILLMGAGYAANKTTNVMRRVKKVDKKDPAAMAAAMTWRPEETVVPKAPPPGTARTRKYKWSITANDHYLWQNSGGTTPLKVDFGGKPPPSAPKDLRKGVRRRSVQKWEEPDGYEYEVIQEERTLELVVEDYFARWFSWCPCCCCCCCCRTKPEIDEESVVHE